MQGTEKTEQPVEDASGVLVYNGDIFDETWDKSFSDTQLILNRLYSLEKVLKIQIIYFKKNIRMILN